MVSKVIHIVASNILSPLGFTVRDNLQAIMESRSMLELYNGKWGLKEPFMASLFTEEQRSELQISDRSFYESVSIQSIRRALEGTGLDITDSRTCLVLSTTKGNVERLEENIDSDIDDFGPASAATNIARYLGISTQPIVVCNACISGVNAQILAMRLLETGVYDNAIVCGAECIGPFIVSGFQSLKTVAQSPCRPFDMERMGLNLGECAATLVMSTESGRTGTWMAVNGAIRNDAMHITNPSPLGEGCMRAINATVSERGKPCLATISVHGTATLFNDQMESKAIERAGLSKTPLFGLKGYLGHTMGANGIAETVLTMAALDKGIIPATRGFEELGVSGKVNISGKTSEPAGKDFLKIISGFGGCNAAVRYKKDEDETLWPRNAATTKRCDHEDGNENENENEKHIECLHCVEITPSSVKLDGKDIGHEKNGAELISELYHRYVGDYPKFFKMDSLSRLAFIASEMLLKQSEATDGPTERTIDAIVLFNHSSSLVSDRKHARLVLEDKDGLASPSVFVYTLPNIAAGEIAIRRHCMGETAFYILPEEDEEMMMQIAGTSLQDEDISTILTGWVDCKDNADFKAKLYIATRLTDK